MMRILILMFAFLCAAPAWAEPAVVETENLMPAAPADEKAADEEKDAPKSTSPEEMALLLCQSRQIMAESQSAEYKPGVDAYGRPVAPADASAQNAYTIPDRIDVPLNIDILKTVGIITTPEPSLSTNVGTISILKGGQVLYNGQDTTATVQNYCNTHASKAKTQ